MTLRKGAEDHHPRPGPGNLAPVGENAVWSEGIACPRCAAPVLRACVDTRGEKRGPHADRVKAAREQGLAPRPGRPRLLDGGEQRRVVLRLSAAEVEALDLYQAEHPGEGDVPALRGIIAEWLRRKRREDA